MPFIGLNTNNDLGQNYGVINNSLRSLANRQDNGAFNPSGVMTMYGGTTAPRGWLLCDGTAISRTQFANLFGVVGTLYGTGDGSTTFNLPDMRGRVAVGQDTGSVRLNTWNTLGQSSGEQNHTLSIDEIPTHNHAFGGDDQIGPQGGYTSISSFAYDATSTTIGSAGNYMTKSMYNGTTPVTGGGAHNTMQPYAIFNYIIKV